MIGHTHLCEFSYDTMYFHINSSIDQNYVTVGISISVFMWISLSVYLSANVCVCLFFVFFFAFTFWCAREQITWLQCADMKSSFHTQGTISAFIMDSLYLACSALGPVCVLDSTLRCDAAKFKAENHFQKGIMLRFISQSLCVCVCVWCIFFRFIRPVHTKFYWQSWNIKLPTRLKR